MLSHIFIVKQIIPSGYVFVVLWRVSMNTNVVRISPRAFLLSPAVASEFIYSIQLQWRRKRAHKLSRFQRTPTIIEKCRGIYLWPLHQHSRRVLSPTTVHHHISAEKVRRRPVWEIIGITNCPHGSPRTRGTRPPPFDPRP